MGVERRRSASPLIVFATSALSYGNKIVCSTALSDSTCIVMPRTHKGLASPAICVGVSRSVVVALACYDLQVSVLEHGDPLGEFPAGVRLATVTAVHTRAGRTARADGEQSSVFIRERVGSASPQSHTGVAHREKCS